MPGWQVRGFNGSGITYADGISPASALSARRILTQLAGLSKERMKAGGIKNSDDFDYLPKPSIDEARLEADFVRWGYCLVADALTPEQIDVQVDRMVEQAEAEKAQGVAIMHRAPESRQPIAGACPCPSERSAATRR